MCDKNYDQLATKRFVMEKSQTNLTSKSGSGSTQQQQASSGSQNPGTKDVKINKVSTLQQIKESEFNQAVRKSGDNALDMNQFETQRSFKIYKPQSNLENVILQYNQKQRARIQSLVQNMHLKMKQARASQNKRVLHISSKNIKKFKKSGESPLLAISKFSNG